MKPIYAISATAFFGILAVSLIFAGNVTTQVTAMIALLFGACSQFLAQDDRPIVQTIALVCAYAGMLMAVLAIVVFALTI